MAKPNYESVLRSLRGKNRGARNEQFDDDRAELEKFPRNLAAVL
jgi:hypothetical protein